MNDTRRTFQHSVPVAGDGAKQGSGIWPWVVVVSLLSASVALADEPATADGGARAAEAQRRAADFRVMWERNVFLSTRHRPVAYQPSAPRQTFSRPTYVGPSDPRADWALRGTLSRGGEFMALLENLKTGQTEVVRAGQQFCGAKIMSVGLDGLRFGDGAVAVVGRNLAGAPTPTAAPTVVALAPTPAPAPTPASAPSPEEQGDDEAVPTEPGPVAAAPAEPTPGTPAELDAMSLWERMRQRRLQQTGGAQ